MPPSRAEPDEPSKKAIEFFDQMEIYPGMFHGSIILISVFECFTSAGSKIKHFQEIHRKTNIPYSQMVSFFLYFLLRW